MTAADPSTPDERRQAAADLTARAERFSELADVAELMGDEATASRLRRDGARCRERAMALLD